MYNDIRKLSEGNKMEVHKKVIEQIMNSPMFEEAKERGRDYLRLMAYYKCAMMEIETKLNVLNEEFSLQHDRNPISSIKTRLKTFDSIARKLHKYGLEPNLESVEEHINDVAGVRVCCSFKEDVYMLAEALLKQDDIEPIIIKDYIKSPKKSGYRSLHLIVGIPIYLANEKRIMKVEIQLRTIAMDFWASLEHQIRYKNDAEFTEDIANELFNCAEMSAELDDRMSKLRKLTED